MRIEPTAPIGASPTIALDALLTRRDPARAPVDVVIEQLTETGATLATEAPLPEQSLLKLHIDRVGVRLAQVVESRAQRMTIAFDQPLPEAALARARALPRLASVAVPQRAVTTPGAPAAPAPRGQPAPAASPAPEASPAAPPVPAPQGGATGLVRQLGTLIAGLTGTSPAPAAPGPTAKAASPRDGSQAEPAPESPAPGAQAEAPLLAYGRPARAAATPSARSSAGAPIPEAPPPPRAPGTALGPYGRVSAARPDPASPAAAAPPAPAGHAAAARSAPPAPEAGMTAPSGLDQAFAAPVATPAPDSAARAADVPMGAASGAGPAQPGQVAAPPAMPLAVPQDARRSDGPEPPDDPSPYRPSDPPAPNFAWWIQPLLPLMRGERPGAGTLLVLGAVILVGLACLLR
ncbi:hypothetical protein [Sphingomonas morindae]|uniref:Uncharacterized protein n=1 Tax=Sphingomonas morindae TaxID=1541170 RepID=A0ABY4XAS5_9SPHN|nr:hypothetical protein [Sphingomonas morindae]USI73994.1 hypothetical protein LHA26_05890 [Sphingomonas morindae]